MLDRFSFFFIILSFFLGSRGKTLAPIFRLVSRYFGHSDHMSLGTKKGSFPLGAKDPLSLIGPHAKAFGFMLASPLISRKLKSLDLVS